HTARAAPPARHPDRRRVLGQEGTDPGYLRPQPAAKLEPLRFLRATNRFSAPCWGTGVWKTVGMALEDAHRDCLTVYQRPSEARRLNDVWHGERPRSSRTSRHRFRQPVRRWVRHHG